MNAKTKLIDVLAGTTLFKPLDEQALSAVAAEMREVAFTPGQVIFTRGEEGKDVYVVLDGRVRLSVLTAEGRELSFAHAEAGSMFGEIAMLDGGERSADATAVSKVRAANLSRGAFLRLIEKTPSVCEAMMQFLCKRIRDADQQLEAIALCPIEVRLARFFLAAAQAKCDGDDIDEIEHVSLDFTMSQGELSLLIGASRPKVNTALSMLEAGGAIRREGKKRIDCDIEQLRDIAGVE